MEGKLKLTHSTDVPYTRPVWPLISLPNQETILSLLIALLEPISLHQSLDTPSKGKRRRKRKRDEIRNGLREASPPLPPPPEILSRITVGLNSTLRVLQNQTSHRHHAVPLEPTESPTTLAPALALIFITSKSLLDVLSTLLPNMAFFASASQPTEPAIRLIHLPELAERRLATALHQAQVSIVGIMADAPGARPLIEFVREHVKPIEVLGVAEVASGVYAPLRVKTVESIVGSAKKTKKKEGKARQRARRKADVVKGRKTKARE